MSQTETRSCDYSPQQIRRLVVDSTCESCPELVEGGIARVIQAQALVRDFALDYADLVEAGLSDTRRRET